MIRFAMGSSVLLLVAALAACGGSDNADTSNGGNATPAAGGIDAPVHGTPVTPFPEGPATPGATPAPAAPTPAPTPVPVSASPTALQISSIELAQTHVIDPAGRPLQSANDATNHIVHRLTLLADRSALLMVQPNSAVTTLQVRARLANGSVLGPLTMAAPAQLPHTDSGRAAYSTSKYSVLLPKEWVQTGAKLEIGQTDFVAPFVAALTVVPGTTLKAYTLPVYLFGASAANSVVSEFNLANLSSNGYRLDQEYQQKLPVAKVDTRVGGAITLNNLVLPAHSDAKLCYPAMPVSSMAAYTAAAGDMNAVVLGLVGNIHGPAANRDGDLAVGFYGYMQAQDGANQVAASSGGGLGGGGSGVSGGDYRPQIVYSAIFNHEMGHAYGLPHADSAFNTGDYPYAFGSKSGSSWGYDANKNQLLSTLQIPGQSCDDRVVNNVCYERTPMSGGDDDRDTSVYRWDNFSDYQAVIMQEGFLDKAIPDASYPGGYKKWNRSTSAFENMSDQLRARIGTDVLALDQQVQTVIGSVSHFNASPSASRMVVSTAWTGNLPKQIDPTLQSDLDLLGTTHPGGWDNYYCVYSGCDYTLAATYGDGTVIRVLLPMGYHRFGYPVYTDSGIRSSAQNVLDADNLGTYAVNLPTGHSGLNKLQLFSTPFGSKWQVGLTAIAANALGSNSYPLINQWTPADGNTGGAGASGNTTFNASACQTGATVINPPH